MKNINREVLLEHYFNLVHSTILVHQNPVTGLCPSAFVRKGSDPQENDLKSHAWVRDNVYISLCVWGLSLGYRKSDDPAKRAQAYELEKSVVKIMRGLLRSQFLQSAKVEQFKQTQNETDALHAKYNMADGSIAVGDNGWGHLQIDATSLFILILAQMTASGIQIVYTSDEVKFVQNLVYYIEFAYRIPDYGIWERGDKTNHGFPELNASSIGMAKAALESISDLDLFGARGGPSSVIHVMADEIRRNDMILKSLLPRESNSKEIGASLLSIIGFPAFAVENDDKIEETRDMIIEKLQGAYGLKRFLRDGYQTAVENRTRLHYELAELQVFDNIECEWPMFFSYLMLDAIFREEHDKVVKYRAITEKLLVEPAEEYFEKFGIIHTSDGCGGVHGQLHSQEHVNTDLRLKVMPQLYYVHANDIQNEYNEPHSQPRIAGHRAPFFWGQSLYILSCLLDDGLIAVGEIDPLNRRLILGPPSNTAEQMERTKSLRRSSSKRSLRYGDYHLRPQLSRRVSFFQSSASQDVVVQINFLVDDKELQKRLAQHQIHVLHVSEINASVLPSSELLKVYTYLGKSQKIGLSGRPCHDIGTLSVCRIYKMNGSLFLFTPPFAEKEKFYLSLDNDLLVDNFVSELSLIKGSWRACGRPTLTILLDSSSFKTSESSMSKSPMMKLIKDIKGGYCNGVRVRMLPLSQLLNTACIENLTFLDDTAFTFSETVTEPVRNYLKTNNSKSIMSSLRRSSVIIADVALIERQQAAEKFEEAFNNGEKNGAYLEMDRSEKKDIPSNLARKDYGKVPVNILWDYLMTSDTIQEQLDILRFLHEVHGNEFSGDAMKEPTVGDLLEEIYKKAGDLQMWIIVRQTAGMLSKQANNLALSVTDILVLRKQISVGIPSMEKQRELFITVPHSASKIQEIIQLACGGDSTICILTEEIILYIAMFVRTHPTLFAEMLRIRIGLIINVMISELARNLECMDDTAFEYLLRRSPIELKNLLRHILSGSEFPSFEDGKQKIYNEDDIANAIGIAAKSQKPKVHSMAALKKDLKKINSTAHPNADMNESVTSFMDESKPTLNEEGFPQLNDDGILEENEENEDENVSSADPSRRGQWLRRRQLDGALNRVPTIFYSDVWHVLKRCHGFTVQGHHLPHHPTVQEMTPGETKFALHVETLLNRIVNAEYRQLTVEVLMLLAMIFKEQPSWYVGSLIDLDNVIKAALNLFELDLRNSGVTEIDSQEDILALFSDNSPSGRHGSMTYLAEAIFRELHFPSPTEDDGMCTHQ